MLLHWSPFSDQPIRLDQAAVKAMTSEQMQVVPLCSSHKPMAQVAVLVLGRRGNACLAQCSSSSARGRCEGLGFRVSGFRELVTPSVESSSTPISEQSSNPSNQCGRPPDHAWLPLGQRALQAGCEKPASRITDLCCRLLQALKMAMLAKASPHTSLPWHSLDDAAKAFLQVSALRHCGSMSGGCINDLLQDGVTLQAHSSGCSLCPACAANLLPTCASA